jgi:hypothetical protein
MLKLCQNIFCPFHLKFNAYNGSSRGGRSLPLAGLLKFDIDKNFQNFRGIILTAAGNWDSFLTVIEIPEIHALGSRAAFFLFFYKTYWIIKKFILR